MAANGWQPKTATVIGAGSGIGRALALELAGRGFSVAALSRSPGNLSSLRTEAIKLRTHLQIFPCDVTDSGDFGRAMQAAGDSAVIVHTAGSALPVGPVWECDQDNGIEALSAMVLSPWLTARLCLQRLLSAGSGMLLLASSGAANKSAPGRSTYSMSKAAVDQLVRVVGAELRMINADVGIAAFYPGMVDTGMQQQMRQAAESYRGSPFGAELAPFLQVSEGGSLLSPAVVAGHIAELAMVGPRELNGRIWRLRDGGWSPLSEHGARYE
ncbi:MAG: short-chain dehydrogenase/reductase [Frankiales bacterium]|nr:short-chain dehydrogenase/reductase [Frankiales bacterium]